MKKGPLYFSHVINFSFLIIFIIIVTIFSYIYSTDYIELNGIIRPLEYQIITSKIPSVLEDKLYTDGMSVKRNQKITQFFSQDYLNRANTLKVDKTNLLRTIEDTKLRFEILKKKNEVMSERRETELKFTNFRFNNGVITKEKYLEEKYRKEIEALDAKAELLSLESEITSKVNALNKIELEINNTNKLLEQCSVYSKLDGIVIENDDSIKEGRHFSPGEPIATIYSFDKIYSEIMIPETEIAKVEVNQPVKLFINALPYTKYKVFEGKLLSIKKDATKGTNFYYGKVEIYDPSFDVKNSQILKNKKLVFGMSLKAKIIVGRKNLFKKLFKLD